VKSDDLREAGCAEKSLLFDWSFVIFFALDVAALRQQNAP
jgi:hypothetical protein